MFSTNCKLNMHDQMCGAPSVEVDISGNEFVNLNMAKDLSTDLLNEFCHIKGIRNQIKV